MSHGYRQRLTSRGVFKEGFLEKEREESMCSEKREAWGAVEVPHRGGSGGERIQLPEGDPT